MNSMPETHDDITVDVETLSNESSRRGFLTTLLAGAAAATTLATVPTSVFAASGKLKYAAHAFPMGDATVLNYALTLEHLETAFYTKAASQLRASGYLKNLISILRYDENRHVAGITAALKSGGYKPVARAKSYNFPAVFGRRGAFLNFASTLEDTGVAAYHGQLTNIKTGSILVTAAQIATVEARHTGAIRALLQQNPTDGAFDQGKTMQQVLAIAGPLIGH